MNAVVGGIGTASIAARERVDAARALSLVFARLQAAMTATQGLGVVVPGYLDLSQVNALTGLAVHSRFPTVQR